MRKYKEGDRVVALRTMLRYRISGEVRKGEIGYVRGLSVGGIVVEFKKAGRVVISRDDIRPYNGLRMAIEKAKKYDAP